MAGTSKPQTLVETNAPLQAKHQIVLFESSNPKHKGRIRLVGPAQRYGGDANENNRIYPPSVWDKNLKEDSLFVKRLKSNRVLGELEHPESGSTHLGRVSHLMEKVWVEDIKEGNPYEVKPGKYILTQSLVLNTPNGAILRELAEVGVPIGTSSRGRGNTQLDPVRNVELVSDDYQLDVWDYVAHPSVSEAAHRPIKEEVVPASADPIVGGPGAPDPNTPLDVPLDSEPAPAPDAESAEEGSPQTIVTGEELVREMEAAVNDTDLADMLELLTRAVDTMDAIGSSSDPKASKIRGQLIALHQVIVNRATALEGLDDSEKDSSKEEKKESTTKKSTITEDLEQLGNTVTKSRKSNGGVVYRGEIENILKQYGHEATTESVNSFAAVLRRKGYTVNEREYADLPKKAVGENRRQTMSTAVAEKTSNAVAQQLVKQLAEARAKIKELEGGVTSDKYQALSSLYERLLASHKQLKESNTKDRKRLGAAVKVIHRILERTREAQVSGYIAEKVSKFKNPSVVASLLESCKTKKAVDEQLAKVTKIVETNESIRPRVRNGEPLPRGLTESTVKSGSDKTVEEDRSAIDKARAAEVKTETTKIGPGQYLIDSVAARTTKPSKK